MFGKWFWKFIGCGLAAGIVGILPGNLLLFEMSRILLLALIGSAIMNRLESPRKRQRRPRRVSPT